MTDNEAAFLSRPAEWRPAEHLWSSSIIIERAGETAKVRTTTWVSRHEAMGHIQRRLLIAAIAAATAKAIPAPVVTGRVAPADLEVFFTSDGDIREKIHVRDVGVFVARLSPAGEVLW